MRITMLSALFALSVGLTATTGASAATIGSGINNASNSVSASLIEKAAYACRRISVCHRGPYGRRVCEIRRVCRHW
ncbi:MAG TPA: hypothetical protein VHT93_14825 [Pseudolabrys sp.]|nr:hypothetical protein [Pseudolabrys sp.]